MRIALLRFENLPRFVTWEVPGLDQPLADDRLLIAGFSQRGAQAASVIWSDRDIDWNTFEVALIRTTWDYIDRCEEFLDVLATIEASSCRLFNALEPVRWNSDKRYLFDLEARGVPIVPTFRVARESIRGVQGVFATNGGNDAILKPTLGGGGANVHRVRLDEVSAGLDLLVERSPSSEYLMQPLIESVMTEGEWSFFYANGRFCHALLKKPAPMDWRTHGIYGGSVEAVKPKAEDARQAATILEKLPSNACGAEARRSGYRLYESPQLSFNCRISVT